MPPTPRHALPRSFCIPRATRPQRHSFSMITPNEPIEEEILPTYRADNYYPATIGQTVGDRYKIRGKLGFGTQSTTWLAQDTKR